MSKEQNHAIIFGASGLVGWSVLDQLLSNYPTPGSFSGVTAVINRPIAEPDWGLPAASSHRLGLQIVSGIDLLNSTADDLGRQLKEKVPDVESVTHIFYFVFNEHSDDYLVECEMNCEMMQRVADTFNALAPNLKSFIYTGGTRGYGIYIPGGTFKPPLEESLAYKLPQDYAKTVAYPWFRKLLTKASEGRPWTWTEICPDAIIGFTPNGSNFSLALHWAQYLSLYAHNHGARKSSSGAPDEIVQVPFPGSEAGYNSLLSPVWSRTLARVALYAALNPETCGEEILNTADRDRPCTFKELWPAIAGWFGLVGIGPTGGGGEDDALKPGEYIEENRHVFAENGRPKALSCGVRAGSKQLDSVGWWLSFDRQLSLRKLRESGFTEENDPAVGWLDAFARFRDAGIIF